MPHSGQWYVVSGSPAWQLCGTRVTAACGPLWDSCGSDNLSLGRRARRHRGPSGRRLSCACQTPTARTSMRRTPHMSVMRTSRRRLAAASAIAVASLAFGTASALPALAADRAPEGVIQNAGAPGAVKGSYIVTLRESAADAGSTAGKALAAEYGAKIRQDVQRRAERLLRPALRGAGEEVRRGPGRRLRRAEPRLQGDRHPAQPAVLGPGPASTSGPSRSTRATPTRTPPVRA